MEYILALIVIVLFTKVAGHLSVMLGQPSVLGKLIAGIILGPAVLNWVQPTEFIDHFAEIGVLLLMFIAGLETDLQQLKENWKASVAVALGGVILPLIGGYGLSIALGLPQAEALFMGLLLCATSVSISVQALKEMNQLSSREGTTILGAAVVDDIVVVIMLAVMISFLGVGGGDVSLTWLIGKKVIFFAIIAVACIWLVPLVMKLASKLKVTEAVMSGAIVICLGFAYFAEWLGVAGIIGSFAAGLAISQTKFRKEVEHRVEPITYTLFVPVFFVSIGLNITFDGLGDQVVFMVLLSIVAIITKLIGCGFGAKLTGFSTKSSLIIGAGMISRGEVALIIATTGLSAGLFPQAYFTSIVLVVIVTTLVTPPLLKAMFSTKQVKQQNNFDVQA